MDTLALSTMVYLGCLYLTWIMLPLIPAVLTFWLFPGNSVAVSGPLANLTVNASGAFAAYLIVFVASVPLVQSMKEMIGGFQRQFWTIKAQVKLFDADGHDFRSNDLIGKIRVRPPAYMLDSYYATFKVPEENGKLPYRVIVEIPEFGEEVLDVNAMLSQHKTDYFNKIVELKTPIEIRQPSLGAKTRPVAVPQARLDRSTETSDVAR